MSSEVSVMLDRERHFRYKFADFRELRRRLGNLAVKQLLEGLGDVDPEILLHVVHVGLKWEEPKMRLERAEELIQIAIDQDGSTKKLMQAVLDALMASGMLGDSNQGNGRSPESQPGHLSD